jgi:hypothetical protein
MKKGNPDLAKQRTRSGPAPDMVLREKFAQAVAAGKSLTDAYKLVRPEATAKPASLNRMAMRFGNEEWVQKRVAEIKADAARIATEQTGIDKAWVVTRLKTVVERCLQAEPVLDREGTPTGEYTFAHAGANKALELLGKEIGMFVDRKEVRTGSLDNISDAELTRLAQEFAAQAGFALAVAGDRPAASGEQATAVPTLQ